MEANIESVFVALVQVVAKDVASEIFGGIAPYGMDVVAVVLDVGDFYEKCSALDAVVVWFATF